MLNILCLGMSAVLYLPLQAHRTLGLIQTAPFYHHYLLEMSHNTRCWKLYEIHVLLIYHQRLVDCYAWYSDVFATILADTVKRGELLFLNQVAIPFTKVKTIIIKISINIIGNNISIRLNILFFPP